MELGSDDHFAGGGRDAGDDRDRKPLRMEPVEPIVPGRAGVGALPFDVSRGLTPDQRKALDHRVRRQALRCLHDAPGGPLTLTEIGEKVGSPLASLSFHLRLMNSLGFVSGRKSSGGVAADGGDMEYSSTVANDQSVVVVLMAMRHADEPTAG